MKSLPSGLQAHLDSGTTTLSWCWKITRSDGGVFGFTDHDLALTFAGTTFEPESGFVPSEIRAAQDFSVDAQDVDFDPMDFTYDEFRSFVAARPAWGFLKKHMFLMKEVLITF